MYLRNVKVLVCAYKKYMKIRNLEFFTIHANKFLGAKNMTLLSLTVITGPKKSLKKWEKSST